MIPEQGDLVRIGVLTLQDFSNALKVGKIGFGRLAKGQCLESKKSRPSEPFKLKIKKPVTTNKAKLMHS